MSERIFDRAELLLGEEAIGRLQNARVILFGVGGVGSWCAESLVRTGVGHLTIVDSDCVNISNVNRQMMATTRTVGQVKVDALKERLLEINPNADICALQMVYDSETANSFHLEDYDVVIDCIDSLKEKALLIERATSVKTKFLSSMGAALKLDPTRIKVAEFWDVKGCPLARALRNKFKKTKTRPRRKFKCVYSDELLSNMGAENSHIKEKALNKKESPTDLPLTASRWDSSKAQINGSLMHITAIFGLTLAGLAISYIIASDNYNLFPSELGEH